MPLFGRRAPSSNFIQMLKDLLEDGKAEAKVDPEKAKVTLRKIHRMISDADPNEKLAIDQNKKDVINILLEAGTLLFELSDKEKSIDYFEKVKEMDPNNARAWYEIGRILVSQNIQIPYATVNLKKALDLDKNNYRVMILLGDIYRIQRDNENAMKLYKEALGLSPEKLEILDRILSIDPSNRDALKEKLKYLLEKGDKEGAAQIYMQLGIIEDNIDFLDEWLKISPDNVSLLKEKARMLLKRGKKSEATQFIERVKKLSPDDPEIAILESMLVEKKAAVEEDLFGDLGISEIIGEGSTNFPEQEKVGEPDVNDLEQAISSGEIKDMVSKYSNSETFIEKLNAVLSKYVGNYEILIPTLEYALKSGIDKEKLKSLKESLGPIFDAISYFLQDKLDDAEKILNTIVLKDQKNALAWFYKARIAGKKNNALAAKNFLMMAEKFGKFDRLSFPELNIAK